MGLDGLISVDPIAFAQQWVAAWNAHDVDAVLEHFHDDVVFTSPVAAKLLPETHGVVRGKPAVRHYWTVAVSHLPNLRFTVERVYQGVDTVVIAYRNQDGVLVSEVLKFDGDLVIEGHGRTSSKTRTAVRRRLASGMPKESVLQGF